MFSLMLPRNILQVLTSSLPISSGKSVQTGQRRYNSSAAMSLAQQSKEWRRNRLHSGASLLYGVSFGEVGGPSETASSARIHSH